MKLKKFQLERYFEQYEFSAPYLLCSSDCESLSINDVLKFEENSQDEFLSLRLGYTESLGSPELRTQIASLYEKSITHENINVHAGAEEAIFNFMNVVLDAGDEIIVHSPHYQSLGEVARSIGAIVKEWKGDQRKSWELSIDELKKILTHKTKVVVVNFPHNPTGYLPTVEFLNELSQLSDELGFIIFSDEVYRGLEYNKTHQLPAFADLNERSISLGVMSKTYGLAGLRIGWIATKNKKLFRLMAEFKDYTTICNSAPSEFLATLALKHRKSIVERNLGIIISNLNALNTFFHKYEEIFDWSEPIAGPIAFPRYKGNSIELFCKQLIEESGVLLLPGTLYKNEYNFFRIGFGRSNMINCLNKLEDFLKKR